MHLITVLIKKFTSYFKLAVFVSFINYTNLGETLNLIYLQIIPVIVTFINK